MPRSGAALAAVHPSPPTPSPGCGAADPVEQYRDVLDGLGEPHPAFELGFRWLDANRPRATDPWSTATSGSGNLLVGPDGLRAVLDWELAHLGDPIEDLGWFCVRAWRFGSALPAGGVATREELVAAYEAASGNRRPGRPPLVGGARHLKWGVMCVMQAWGHLSGAARSVELATIGRRVCENEWDLLGLLPVRRPPRAPVAPEPAATRPSRPSDGRRAGRGRAGVDRRRRAGPHRGTGGRSTPGWRPTRWRML